MVSILLDLMRVVLQSRYILLSFLLLDRMFSACQLGLTVLFRSSSFLLGAGFLFFSVHFWNRVDICNHSCGFVYFFLQRMSGLDGSTNSMAMDLSKLQEKVKDREAWRAAAPGAAESQTLLSGLSPVSLGRLYFARRMRVWIVWLRVCRYAGSLFPSDNLACLNLSDDSTVLSLSVYVLQPLPSLSFSAVVGLCRCVQASPVAGGGGCSSLRCPSFPLQWPLWLQSMGASCSSQAPELGLSSRGTGTYWLCRTGDPPLPGVEPVSLALQGRFLTPGPPGKPSLSIFYFFCNLFISLYSK